jgi:hypothetical protein
VTIEGETRLRRAVLLPPLSAGYYKGQASNTYGFMRTQDGTTTTFEAPGQFGGSNTACGINDVGSIVGLYFDSNTEITYGYLRRADGSMTKFSLPGSTDTEPQGINNQGVVVGSYYDPNLQGFIAKGIQ